jgi:radical SAM superfamily enzyme YgiQ (UPF0313 family)
MSFHALIDKQAAIAVRRYLGEDPTAPIRHPEIASGMNTGMMGIRLPNRKGGTAATVIPSVGCPLGCNFCTTSAFFGGKGKFINFYTPATNSSKLRRS